MYRIPADRVLFEVHASIDPIATVPLGELFGVATRDALDGQVWEGQQEMPEITRANPVTGPIRLEGVRAGHCLRIDILSVDPAATGYLTFQKKPRFFRQSSGILHLFSGMRLRMEPMVGTIGFLPAAGSATTKDGGDYGGNLDTRDVAAGCSLYLTAQTDGGGLFLGDVHSLQGDGETSGQGVETAAEVVLRVTSVTRAPTRRPYLVKDGELMVVVSADTLDEAAEQVVEETAQLLAAESRLDCAQARMLLGVRGDLRVGQMVNPHKTVRMAVPLSLIPWDSTDWLGSRT